MKNIARWPDEDRADLFRNTAAKMGLHDAIVEKDFWVCFTLDYLFHRSPWPDKIVFKGGTSLSKAYDLISRFSEDIDLILDWRELGYSATYPMEERSNTRQSRVNEEISERAEAFLENDFCPALKAGLTEDLGREAKVYKEPGLEQTVIFEYPALFQNGAILPVIRLEIGPLAAWTPASEVSIKPYVAAYYPKFFEQAQTEILTVRPERTFWEKATILHHEANRPLDRPMPPRYSRHYYDLYKMAASPVKEKAFQQLELLKRVVEFKMKFYPRGWARYPDAKPGTMKLVPPTERWKELEADYKKMRMMLYGDVPQFDTMMKGIQKLEQEINALPDSQ